MRRVVSLLVAVVLGAWFLLRPEAVPGPSATPVTPPSVSAAPSARPAESSVRQNTRGFRNTARLDEHYQKHGAEFGRVTIEEYLVMAQSLRDAPVGGNVLETVRSSDGVVSRFDRATGAFLAADPDGTIRTFFKPNDGEAYFRRQANRRPSP